MLYYKGKVDGIKKREYQGRTRTHLQFVMTDETGELAFLEVRVPDAIQNNFTVGQNIEVPVTYSVMNGEVFFKVDEKNLSLVKVAKNAA